MLQTPWKIEQLIKSWKAFTARKINELLGQEGRFWQRDYFDRLVRDHSHFARCIRYIRNNPKKAKLREGEYILYESELARGIA